MKQIVSEQNGMIFGNKIGISKVKNKLKKEDKDMKTSELIALLNESLEQNGDLDVVGIAMGEIHPYVDINCPDEDSPLYIELAK